MHVCWFLWLWGVCVSLSMEEGMGSGRAPHFPTSSKHERAIVGLALHLLLLFLLGLCLFLAFFRLWMGRGWQAVAWHVFLLAFGWAFPGPSVSRSILQPLEGRGDVVMWSCPPTHRPTHPHPTEDATTKATTKTKTTTRTQTVHIPSCRSPPPPPAPLPSPTHPRLPPVASPPLRPGRSSSTTTDPPGPGALATLGARK